ncbi:ATP-binding cassette domain-containing protein [Fontisubflavum oceani]|uniref:energy-coupling factor ABC transporter ATP-binding protein n=1 Tax=Fontisubflavum oceani TaxID=2978973 RepID=UPI0025B3624D|nr:ATP-binding cassette domain-containing protein [Fontisubflavum oceani]WJY20370.1 ATP-binding cassette domain-containing protein [Fontisubflavum oceani]
MVNSILPLRVEAAEVKRRGTRLIGPIDLTLGKTGVTIVLGPNGSGKTTLLRLMQGLERPAHGSLVWSIPEAEVRTKLAFVFQTPTMMRRSVTDSIAYALTVAGTKRAEARKRAREIAEQVGLGHALDRSAGVLSGGEKQKLALARALIRQPEILFLDEPCANLDGRATREIEAILTDAKSRDTRIVMSTHDLGQAARLADEIVFMLNGCVHETGPAERFFSTPETPEAHAFLNGQIVE